MGKVSPVSQSTMRLPADFSSRAWLLLPFAFAASMLLGYGVIGLVLWGCETCVSYFIFQPDRTLYAKPADFSFNVRDVGLPVTVPGDAGQSLHGWWVAAAAWDAKVVLYLHGNDGNVSTSVGEIAPLRELGYAVFMPDYRGYGESEGPFPSEKTVYEDAEAAWIYLVEQRGFRPAKLYIYGHSLGGAIAIELALHHPEAAGLIVESSFTSIREMAKLRKRYALLPMQLLSQRFDSIQKVSKLRLPVLYVHGTADEVVPYAMGEQLFRASGGRKRFIAIGGGLHHNNAAVGGPLLPAERQDVLPARGRSDPVGAGQAGPHRDPRADLRRVGRLQRVAAQRDRARHGRVPRDLARRQGVPGRAAQQPRVRPHADGQHDRPPARHAGAADGNPVARESGEGFPGVRQGAARRARRGARRPGAGALRPRQRDHGRGTGRGLDVRGGGRPRGDHAARSRAAARRPGGRVRRAGADRPVGAQIGRAHV